MKKQTKVLVAAAMLTLGASFSAMAAEKGTWQYEGGEWYCYDEDGDVYEEVWCKSDDGSKEYWVNDEGVMVVSDWVDNGTYYVNSEGLKAKNEWRKLVPYEADEDADAESFYFGSNGKKYTGKKVIDGNTYYFDENGILLTGWINIADDNKVNAEADTLVDGAEIVYTLEEGEFRGARVATDWVYTWEPGADKDEDDQYWYYIDAKGKATFGMKRNIKGATYLFGNDGRMLSGWVVETGSNSDEYEEIGTEANENVALSTFTGDVFFCGAADDGHVQKNKWIEEYNVGSYAGADEDTDKYWFWLEKDGSVYKNSTTTAANKVTFVDGEEADPFEKEAIAGGVTTKEINDEIYAFDANGQMKSGLIEIDNKIYYFGASTDGARKDGAQTIADDYGVDYKFFFNKKTDAAVVGAEGGKLYKNGLLVTSGEDKYALEPITIDGTVYNFIINKSGNIQTTAKEYKVDDVVIINTKETDTYKYVFHTGKDGETSVPALKGSYTKVNK